jgi:hypothetical protein
MSSGQNERPFQRFGVMTSTKLWTVALVPLLAGKSKSFQIIVMDRIKPNERERKHFFTALLQIDWLPDTLRGAVLKELGSSLRKHRHEFKRSETMRLRALVKEVKARMRKNGERPKGGIDDAALDEVAEREGLPSGVALEKQLQRYK